MIGKCFDWIPYFQSRPVFGENGGEVPVRIVPFMGKDRGLHNFALEYYWYMYMHCYNH